MEGMDRWHPRRYHHDQVVMSQRRDDVYSKGMQNGFTAHELKMPYVICNQKLLLLNSWTTQNTNQTQICCTDFGVTRSELVSLTLALLQELLNLFQQLDTNGDISRSGFESLKSV